MMLNPRQAGQVFENYGPHKRDFVCSNFHRIHGTGTFIYIGLICMVNVGKYSNIPYMDPMGLGHWFFFSKDKV